MKLGDTITVAGVEWTVRPFTAAEHQRFDELAEAHDLHAKAAAAAVAQGHRAGTMREQLLKSQARQLATKLEAFLDEEGDLRPDLSTDMQLQAFELAAQLDAVTERAEAIKSEPLAEVMVLEDQVVEARERVMVEFMREILDLDPLVEELRALLTSEEHLQLQEVISLGKLRAGLSASTRQQQVLWARVLKQRLNEPPTGTGSASTSRPSRPAAPAKPGRRGRSKTPSGTSKAGG